MPEKPENISLEQLKLDNEARKSSMEFYKYVGTLTTGMIVVIGSLYEKIFPLPDKVIFFLIVCSLLCFVLSAALTIFGMIASMSINEIPKPIEVIMDKISQFVAALFTAVSFLMGILFFVFAIIITNISTLLK